MPNSYRVVQWNTGNVGKSSLKSIADNPTLELVGCYAWSPEKVGRDAGELLGIAPLGVAATNDVDALLALKPDCVVYNPMWIDVGELVRILSAGVNVVTTASFVTGHNLGAGRNRILEAADTTFYDSPETEKPVGFGQPIEAISRARAGGIGLTIRAPSGVNEVSSPEVPDLVGCC